MITGLKKLWDDVKSLSRFEFGCKYVFPAFAVIMTWGSLAKIYAADVEKNQLVLRKGAVNSIGIRSSASTKKLRRYPPLYISLGQFSDDFHLDGGLSAWFVELQQRIHVGDTIKIYTRNDFQATIGWGSSTDIYQIEKNNDILFSLRIMIDHDLNSAKLLCGVALFFWTLYILYKLKIIRPT